MLAGGCSIVFLNPTVRVRLRLARANQVRDGAWVNLMRGAPRRVVGSFFSRLTTCFDPRLHLPLSAFAGLLVPLSSNAQVFARIGARRTARPACSLQEGGAPLFLLFTLVLQRFLAHKLHLGHALNLHSCHSTFPKTRTLRNGLSSPRHERQQRRSRPHHRPGSLCASQHVLPPRQPGSRHPHPQEARRAHRWGRRYVARGSAG